jgi:hypothetical protein
LVDLRLLETKELAFFIYPEMQFQY